jgi:hypothetical protein
MCAALRERGPVTTAAGEGWRDVVGAAEFELVDDVETERGSHSPNLVHLLHSASPIDIGKDCQAAQARDDLLQELQSLAGSIRRLGG